MHNFTYACPASSTKRCVNFLFVLNFPKMASVPHTTLRVFTSWISLTSVVEYFLTWSDKLLELYQERLTILRISIPDPREVDSFHLIKSWTRRSTATFECAATNIKFSDDNAVCLIASPKKLKWLNEIVEILLLIIYY